MVVKSFSSFFAALTLAALLLAVSLSTSQAFAVPIHARTLEEQVETMNGFENDCTTLMHAPTEAFHDASVMSVDKQGFSSIRVSGSLPPGASLLFSSDSVTFQNSKGAKRQFNFGLTKVPPTSGKDGTFSFVVAIPRAQTATFQIVLTEGFSQEYTLTIAVDRAGRISQAVLNPFFKDDIRKKFCPRDRLALSSGLAFFSYSQQLNAVKGTLAYSSIGLPTGSIVYNHVSSPKSEDVYSLKSLTGQIKASSNFSGDLSFNWMTASYHHQLRMVDWIRPWRGSMLHPFFRYGVQLHQMPMVRLDLADSASIDKNKMANASGGAGVTLFTEKNFMSELYMDLQYPVYTSTKVDYGLIFDGSISLFQTLGKRMFWGVQWFGQYNQLKYSRSGFDREGTVSFFSSNVELALGARF